MKIIWLLPEMPLPANTGGRIVSLKRIEYLNKRNEISLFVIVDSDKDYEYADELKKYSSEVHLYNRREHKFTNLLRTFVKPYPVASRTSLKMKRDIYDCAQRIQPDLIMVDFPQMLGNVDSRLFSRTKIVLNQHNTEFQIMRNLSKSIRNPLKRLIFQIEASRLERLESKLYKKLNISLYTFVSTEDKAFFEQHYGKHNTFLVPVGCELKECEDRPINNGNFNIMYFGKMEYPPNAEAAAWFADKVFSILCKSHKNVNLYIVGKNPLDFVVDLQKSNEHIHVTGTVPEVASYYEKADVVVVPLFHGGGVKVKLLEALGYGKLVISTSKGLEGTDLVANKHLLVADSNDQFVNLCENLISDISIYDEVRANGYNFVRDNYTWKSIGQKFEQQLSKTI